MKETIRRQSIPRPRAVFAIETGELTARLGDDSVEGGHVVQAEFRLACHIDDTFCHHPVRPEIAQSLGCRPPDRMSSPNPCPRPLSTHPCSEE